MARESTSTVLVTHPHAPMRLLLRMTLVDDGYTVMETPNYSAVLRRLRRATDPMVVVTGNWQADFRAEQKFFGRIAADAALARRHRFVLFCTLPEWMPAELDAALRGLGVTVLRTPSIAYLREAVAVAAGRTQAEADSAG
jgi:hypothetical protein